MQFLQLRQIDRARRLDHEVSARLRLGERNHVADVVGAHDVHHQAVESERDAAVRRRAVAKGTEQEPELRVRILGCQADELEDALLHIHAVDADRSAGDLAAVENQVVARAQACARIALEDPELVRVGARERVVQRNPALAVLVPVEHREVDHPEEVPAALGDEAEVARQLQAQLAHRLGCDVPAVAGKEHRIADLEAKPLDEPILDRLEELGDPGLEAVGGELHDRDATGLERADPLRVAVGHLARELLGAARHADALDHALATGGAALGERFLEHLEIAGCREVRHVVDVQIEARIRPVDAVALHGLGVGHHRHLADVVLEELGPQATNEAGHHGHHVFALDEGHLEVDLAELGLAVGSGILVAQAPADLHVAVAASDHQDLLEELRALRQGVPTARVQAAGHDEVASALGGALDEQGSLDLHEAVAREVIARELGDAASGLEDVLHARPTQVDVPVAQSRFLVDLLGVVLVGKDRRGLCLVEHLEALDDHLDFAGGELGVGAAGTQPHRALHGHHVLASEGVRRIHHVIGTRLEVEDHLGQALLVAQVDEEQPLALVAVGVDPSANGDGLSSMDGTELAAEVGALEHGGACRAGDASRHDRWPDGYAPDHASRARRRVPDDPLHGLRAFRRCPRRACDPRAA